MVRDLNNEKLIRVATCTTEAEASMLVDVLADEGIRAVSTGGFSANFRAEAPGYVYVQVLEPDAETAKVILDDLKPMPIDVDD